MPRSLAFQTEIVVSMIFKFAIHKAGKSGIIRFGLLCPSTIITSVLVARALPRRGVDRVRKRISRNVFLTTAKLVAFGSLVRCRTNSL